MAIHELVELIAYLYFDGKIDGKQASRFELKMFETLVDQLKNDTNLSRRSLVLCWLYFKAHAWQIIFHKLPFVKDIEVKNVLMK